MTLTAIILILLYAVLHTAWNLIAKRAPKTAAFYAATLFVGLILYSPACVPHIAAHRAILGAWPMFVVSGVFLAVYYVLMAATYRRADLSVAYPLLRLAPIFITAWSLIFLDEKISALGLAGIGSIVVGGMILPQKSLRITRATFDLKHYFNKTYAMALTAAFSTSIYVVVDKSAMTRFNPDGDFRVAFDYVFLEMCVCAAALAIFGALRHNREAWRQLRAAKAPIFLIAPMLIGAYVLVMGALAIPGVGAAYVGAFRQVSVVLAVAAAVVLLKEKFGRVRIAAALVIFGGLCVLVLG